MGTWGTGIQQNDTFCEVQESFRERWDAGEPPQNIAKELMDQMHSDPEAHIAVLAVADSLWHCDALEAMWLLAVREIVEEDVDISYWMQMNAPSGFIRNRRVVLRRFVERLEHAPSPKQKWHHSLKKSFPYSRGTTFWYKMNRQIFGAVVLQDYESSFFLIAISERLDNPPTNAEEVLRAPAYTAAWFGIESLLPQRNMHLVGNVTVNGDYVQRAGLHISGNGSIRLRNCGQRGTWAHTYRAFSIHGASIQTMLNSSAMPFT